MKQFAIIIASIILLIDLAYVGDSVYGTITTHIAIHNPGTSQDLYETLWDIRLRQALASVLFAVLGVPAVGWLVMLIKSYKSNGEKGVGNGKSKR